MKVVIVLAMFGSVSLLVPLRMCDVVLTPLGPADDTLENVQAVDKLLGGQVNTIYVDGMHGRGIMRNATYRAAATRLCAAGEGEAHSDDHNAAALSQLRLQ